ncbi:hypothetical protein SLEP1_g44162 [Rubroshorea leprosula]|uniref:DUF4219 domain-containing protein n=1 Tax=Rubroshorea leprosula TaxID=152421 RepID=A0AAV5LFB9_9ROSI|nr:hypothetical protein SLEP1_g44162 [Rubroshorea leprosula]
MARTITSTVLVPDVLSQGNYKEWSNCMRNYLLAQDLWDVVEPNDESFSTDEEPTANWNRKNAAVLHALQISCAPGIFARIMGKTSAREAWEELAKIHDEKKNTWLLDGLQSSSRRLELRRFFEGIIPGKTEHIKRSRSNTFLNAIFDGNWEEVLNLLEECPPHQRNPQFMGQGCSILHLAVGASGNVEVVKKLVQIMSEQEILSQDIDGCTALDYAVNFGATDIAACLTIANKKLLTIQDKKGRIPVVRACVQRFKETTVYLYFQTLEFLAPDKGQDGSLLLHFCILNEMPDIALHLLHKYPGLAFTKFKDNNQASTPILTLSAQASLFPSGTRLSFLHQWIYYGISVASEDKEVKAPALATDPLYSLAEPSFHFCSDGFIMEYPLLVKIRK